MYIAIAIPANFTEFSMPDFIKLIYRCIDKFYHVFLFSMRTELKTASRATPTSAETAPQNVTYPNAPANSTIPFTPSAPMIF